MANMTLRTGLKLPQLFLPKMMKRVLRIEIETVEKEDNVTEYEMGDLENIVTVQGNIESKGERKDSLMVSEEAEKEGELLSCEISELSKSRKRSEVSKEAEKMAVKMFDDCFEKQIERLNLERRLIN